MSTSDDSTSNQLPLPFTITIPLTQGYSAVVDAIDADLADFKWTVLNHAGILTPYARRNVPVNGKIINTYLHKIVLSRILERELAKNERCDHVNLNGLDNRRENLRLATPSQNAMNRRKRKDNTSGYKGAHWSKHDQVWLAKITLKGKEYRLGSFDTAKEAHAAYCKAAEELFGEFARFE